MRIQLKRGLEANRGSVTPLAGEPLWTTDNKKLWIDGVEINKDQRAISDDLTSDSADVAASSKAVKALNTKIDALGSGDHVVSANFDNATNKLTLTKKDGTTSETIIPDDKVLLVNDLTTGGTSTALTAEQGKVLATLVNDLKVGDLADVDGTAATNGQALIWDTDKWKATTLPTGVTTFTALTDTVALSAAVKDQVLVVNAAGDGVTYTDTIDGGAF